MAEPKKRIGTRKPKSLAYAFRILAGLIGKVDPLTGIYQAPVPSIQIAAGDLSPEIQRRFKESGIVVVEPVAGPEGVAPQLRLRLPRNTDARQYELPLTHKVAVDKFLKDTAETQYISRNDNKCPGVSCCSPSVFGTAEMGNGPTPEQVDRAVQLIEKCMSPFTGQGPLPEPVSCPTSAPFGGS